MSQSRFDRGARLLKPSEFEAVLRRREMQVNVPPVQFLARRNDLQRARLGLVVAKRHLPRAVDRNRLRRLVRESFRLHAASLPGLDIVVLQRQRLTADASADFRARLDASWARLAAQESRHT